MSTLIVQIPPQPRLRTSARGPASASSRAGIEYNYVLSTDGLVIKSDGKCAAALLPKATTTIAVLSDSDVSWHRITMPKAPAARLQTALVGILEEALLEDADSMHLAVAPDPKAGEPTWVVAVNRSWLSAEMDALEQAGVFVDRIVPVAWPDEPPTGHFAETLPESGGGATGATLSWAHADGVILINMEGSLARALLPTPLPPGVRWSATPMTAAAAEKWLGVSVAVMDSAQRSLQAARSLWNLRQFKLARKNRGMRALRDTFRQFSTPAWRPMRTGLVTLVLVQIIGLNLWATQQRSAIDSKRKAMVSLVKKTHPHIGGILDAPAQMQRETDALRVAAGKPGDADLEPMLQATASAWPAGRPPVDKLRYEVGRLTLTVSWEPEQIEAFRNQLRPSGWQVDASAGILTLSRLPLGAAASAGRTL